MSSVQRRRIACVSITLRVVIIIPTRQICNIVHWSAQLYQRTAVDADAGPPFSFFNHTGGRGMWRHPGGLFLLAFSLMCIEMSLVLRTDGAARFVLVVVVVVVVVIIMIVIVAIIVATVVVI